MLILASASPRRHELLHDAGLTFDIVASAAEEIHDHDIPPPDLCKENAARKAREVAARHPQATVIGADTLVFLDGEALGKPADLDEARAMLRKLSGRTHFVCTGVCIVHPDEREVCFHEITDVSFRTLSETDIETYLTRAHTLDKAGSYGIQEHGDLIVEGISGSYDNVMGLPVARLLRELVQETSGNGAQNHLD
jgi:septum formation protein